MPCSTVLVSIVAFIIFFLGCLFTVCKTSMSIGIDETIKNHPSRIHNFLLHPVANASKPCHCSFCYFHWRRCPNLQSRKQLEFLSAAASHPQPVIPSSPLRASPSSSDICTRRFQAPQGTTDFLDSSPHPQQRRQNKFIRANTEAIHIPGSHPDPSFGTFKLDSEDSLYDPWSVSEEDCNSVHIHVMDRLNSHSHLQLDQQTERNLQAQILSSTGSLTYDGGYQSGLQRTWYLRLQRALSFNGDHGHSTPSFTSTPITNLVMDSPPHYPQPLSSANSQRKAPTAKDEDQGVFFSFRNEALYLDNHKDNVKVTVEDNLLETERKALKKAENERYIRTRRKKLYAKNVNLGMSMGDKENATPLVPVPVPIPIPVPISTPTLAEPVPPTSYWNYAI
ncbi:hypothetical protein D9758_015491 [Tetrapyrgos nigripes]|uniref:Uncharacterized protein n=1 Tax=Tetrapyrgos nigripes TaxID=182062 RepID=A0A8H5FC78_9AGAR|nr:hypothetical protein D9758_015491 [Tetrapyrgos nigripes]